jgi:hypothetical protein
MIKGGENMNRKKTQKEYVDELAIKNPTVEVVGMYVDAKTPILHRCKIDNYEWFGRPNNILRGSGCPMCYGNAHKTLEQYIHELHNVNANVEVLEDYVNAKTPIRHRCKIDGYMWNAMPTNILNGEGCPMCRNQLLSMKFCKTHRQYVNECMVANPYVEIIGVYVDSKTPIAHRCKIDNYEWYARPDNMLSGYGCPMCGHRSIGSKLRKTIEQYRHELSEFFPHITVVDQYINCEAPIRHYCKIHNCTFTTSPRNVLRGCGCSACGTQMSHGERQIVKWLTNHNIDYITQKRFADCKDLHTLPFDFYLPTRNMCIEYDGQQHFEPVDFAGKGEKWALERFIITQCHDQIKNKYCAHNKILLLRIPYFENIDESLRNFLFI